MCLSFEEAYKQYEKYIDLKLKIQSKRAIKSRFKVQILPYWKNYDIYKINEIDYLNYQCIIDKKNYSYKYKQTIHIAMVIFLNFCMKFYNLEKNVASNVGGFKNNNLENKTYNFYNYEEFCSFIKHVEKIEYKLFFEFMFFVGTRPGETMALKFSDLNDSIISIQRTIDERYDPVTKKRTINSPKTRTSIRQIEIDKKLNSDLQKLKEIYIQKYKLEDYDYFIFGGIKPLAPTTINRYKEKACEKAKLIPIRLHDFRHSHATLLVNNNLPIKEISRRLGHSNIETTLNIYVHTDKEQEKRVINTLNSLRLNWEHTQFFQ